MSRQWTSDQKKAIELEGCNLLISAGAGSGKTAVLVERICRKIKEGVSLKNLVVLTFTDAAAFEMKERLRKQLIMEIETKKESSQINGLQNELEYIDQANIQTFDAFSLFLVKKYHYLLGVDNDINVGSAPLLSLQRKKIVEEVLKEKYEESDCDFEKFISTYCIKNDQQLSSSIISIDKKLDLSPNKEEILTSGFSSYFDEEFIKKQEERYLELLFSKIADIKKELLILEKLQDHPKLEELYETILDDTKGVVNAKSYIEIKEEVFAFEYSKTMPRKLVTPKIVAFKNVKEKIKSKIDEIKELCKYQSLDELSSQIEATKDIAKVLSDILIRVNKKFKKYKKEFKVYEFMDISKMAIEIMEKNEAIRKSYKDSINEILVDEYQDTSDIQERLISLIQNDNVYVVGDVKQSIYRFRNANPNIFRLKYDNFSNENGGKVISLSENFRSRGEVLDGINKVFEGLMNENIGGANYNSGHALIFGNKTYEKNKCENNSLEIIEYDQEELSAREMIEYEARTIASDIIQKIKSGYKIYDKKEEKLRNARYDDFAILMQDKKDFDTFRKIFDEYSIPIMIHKNETFINTSEIVVIKNILKCVYSLSDNDYYEKNYLFSLVSVLRSFLVEASDSDIYNYIHEESDIFNDVLNLLKDLNDFSKNSTIGELLEKIYSDFNIYQKIYKLGNVETVESRINHILDEAYRFSKYGNTLADFIEYLDFTALENAKRDSNDVEFNMDLKFTKDICNLLTIHKSKGLEYKVCYIAQTAKNFVINENKERIIFDKDLGLICSYFDEGLHSPFTKLLFNNFIRKEEISEKIRLLYVALTRAEEKLIIVTPKLMVKDFLSDEIYDSDKIECLNFHKMLSLLSNKLQKYCRTPDIIKPTSSTVLLNEVSEKVEFESVKLEKEKIIKKHASMTNKQLSTPEEKEKMNFGTTIHSYFERVNNKEDVEKLNIPFKMKKYLNNFLNSDILNEEIINSYHEYEFIYHMDKDLYHGFIDLLLETADDFIIIDYKLKNIDKEEYDNQLKVYANYLKEVTDKNIRAYLYSIMDNKFKKIEV